MHFRGRSVGFRLLQCGLPLAFGCIGAFPQANSDLMGIVTDQSGAVVVKAKVVLTDPATGVSKQTESSTTGLFDIPALNPATYSLMVSAPGFKSFIQNGITIDVSSTARVDVKLTIGGESQTVVVRADPLRVQTDSNVVSTVITLDQISDIATEKSHFYLSGSTRVGGYFRFAGQQHAHCGECRYGFQREWTSPESQYLVDRRRGSR
jgi:Carboxypeptidase regulatory-like domain